MKDKKRAASRGGGATAVAILAKFVADQVGVTVPVEVAIAGTAVAGEGIDWLWDKTFGSDDEKKQEQDSRHEGPASGEYQAEPDQSVGS